MAARDESGKPAHQTGTTGASRTSDPLGAPGTTGASHATGSTSGDGQQQRHRPSSGFDIRTRPDDQHQLHGPWSTATGTTTTAATSPTITGVHSSSFATGHGDIPATHHGTATAVMDAQADIGEEIYGRDEKKGMSERIEEMKKRLP